ncbi:uncharacterized protein LOC132720623 isoform X2 [Ruditapes philippinarum]|uniref:uncharacterized protein LOC132720623 isoform X2 n=1 Tax=Ruditapes philippinarum TaxID=129788 RepID=UPI00295AC92A|nr:uncharacterized protein LOC132720623 isoform X2 [Ruditapes philippinarum]
MENLSENSSPSTARDSREVSIASDMEVQTHADEVFKIIEGTTARMTLFLLQASEHFVRPRKKDDRNTEIKEREDIFDIDITQITQQTKTVIEEKMTDLKKTLQNLEFKSSTKQMKNQTKDDLLNELVQLCKDEERALQEWQRYFKDSVSLSKEKTKQSEEAEDVDIKEIWDRLTKILGPGPALLVERTDMNEEMEVLHKSFIIVSDPLFERDSNIVGDLKLFLLELTSHPETLSENHNKQGEQISLRCIQRIEAHLECVVVQIKRIQTSLRCLETGFKYIGNSTHFLKSLDNVTLKNEWVKVQDLIKHCQIVNQKLQREPRLYENQTDGEREERLKSILKEFGIDTLEKGPNQDTS